MSADNGVYILKTGRQYRVAHKQAIERLYWNEQLQQTMQPKAILEMFGDCAFTYSADKAIYVAEKIFEELSYCEYGIQIIDAHMTWKEILNKAKENDPCD